MTEHDQMQSLCQSFASIAQSLATIAQNTKPNSPSVPERHRRETAALLMGLAFDAFYTMSSDTFRRVEKKLEDFQRESLDAWDNRRGMIESFRELDKPDLTVTTGDVWEAYARHKRPNFLS